MASKIKAADIEYVKTQINIADVVADYVALKSAGIDSMKGLCPFHDERSPSFHVRPNLGYYHCFGCGESGDTIKFLQQMDHLTFVEAVEKLAAKIGFQLTYEDSGFTQSSGPSKTRLYEANLIAQKYFSELLFTESGQNAKSILNARGFDDDALQQFGIGLASNSWDGLLKHLRKKGFSDDESLAAGLIAKGDRNTYDRFRNRLIWPISDPGGQILGFGARKIDDAADGPKYLNTPETALYSKARVLYGIDKAKRAIAKKKRVVVVEGYTDVMACHLAGITEAVATCGTAFGTDHISLLRRIMGDDSASSVIFTFDPDEAGKQAALKAFSNEHLFKAQTYVAIPKENLDPADLRMQMGDEALQNLFENTKPLFSFALENAVNKFDINSVEGRVSALRQAIPIVAGIKDPGVREGYARELASILGLELSEIKSALKQQSSRTRNADLNHSRNDSQLVQQNNINSPGYRLEKDAITAMIQLPKEVGAELMNQAITAHLNDPDLQVIRDAIAQQISHFDSNDWAAHILSGLPEPYHRFFHELLVAPVPQHNPAQLANYAKGIVAALLERDLLFLKRELIVRLQRLPEDNEAEHRLTQQQIQMLEQARRALKTITETE